MSSTVEKPVLLSSKRVEVSLYEGDAIDERMPGLLRLNEKNEVFPLSRNPRWLHIFRDCMKHRVFVLEASEAGQVVGYLPLVFMKSMLFGKRLVSMPYVNTSGVETHDGEAGIKLVDEAIKLAGDLHAKSLELRHEEKNNHQGLSEPATQKIHMRLDLPKTTEQLWKGFDPKVRNQVRKGEKNELTVTWGGNDQLPAFYEIFAQNMRDLGTPVFSLSFFRSIISTFPNDAEFCVVRKGDKAIAAALLLHGKGITEVPSASSLREFNSTCANMLMYWHLLQRAVGRGQTVFDFGRSSPDSPTHQFKKQWGADPHQAVWQYYLRTGTASDMRPDNPKYRLMIRTWKKLPVWLTRVIGPSISRVIP